MRRFFLLSLILFSIIIIFEKDFFVIKTSFENSSENSISTVILPHFDITRDKRVLFLENLSKKISPQKIIIVSVNHFNYGKGDIITSDKNWDFIDSSPKINTTLFNNLVEYDDRGLISVENGAFINEHGIKGIFPEILRFFPESEYLPIIIKGTTSKFKMNGLISLLRDQCSDCLLITSIDFSHYCPNSLANIHDQMSLDALFNLDTEKAWLAETDSPQSLYLAINWARIHDDRNFSLVDHSNSGKDYKDNEMETTSYILGYFGDGINLISREKKTTFLIGGDLMLDRLVYHQFKDEGLINAFDKFGPRVFRGVDLSMLNLEGVITEEEIIDDISEDNLSFEFSTETIDILKFLKVNTVSLANNHTFGSDFDIFINTEKKLGQNDLYVLGSKDTFNQNNILRINSDIPLSIIAINILDMGESKEVIDSIKTEKKRGRFIIMYPHWGSEYQNKHSYFQEELAHMWIDSGADLIIGSHPHVIQDFEIYKKRPIIYSLGNFVFDQYFSRETQEGLLVGGIIKKDGIEISFFPVKSFLMPELIRGEKRLGIIENLLNIDSNEQFERISDDSIFIPF